MYPPEYVTIKNKGKRLKWKELTFYITCLSGERCDSCSLSIFPSHPCHRTLRYRGSRRYCLKISDTQAHFQGRDTYWHYIRGLLAEGDTGSSAHTSGSCCVAALLVLLHVVGMCTTLKKSPSWWIRNLLNNKVAEWLTCWWIINPTLQSKWVASKHPHFDRMKDLAAMIVLNVSNYIIHIFFPRSSVSKTVKNDCSLKFTFYSLFRISMSFLKLKVLACIHGETQITGKCVKLVSFC